MKLPRNSFLLLRRQILKYGLKNTQERLREARFLEMATYR